MKVNKFIFICITLLSAVLIYSTKAKAKIFVLNAFSEPVDIQLGLEKNKIFSAANVESNFISKLVTTNKTGKYKLIFKLSSSSNWYYWMDENTQTPVQCSVDNGKIHCIIIDKNGIVNFFILDDIPNKLGTKISFINNTNTPVYIMEVSKKFTGLLFADEIAAFADNLEPAKITSFVFTTPGDYSIFWQFEEQKEKKLYYFYPDHTETSPKVFNFKKNKYYIFMIYTKDDYPYGEIIELLDH